MISETHFVSFGVILDPFIPGQSCQVGGKPSTDTILCRFTQPDIYQSRFTERVRYMQRGEEDEVYSNYALDNLH